MWVNQRFAQLECVVLANCNCPEEFHRLARTRLTPTPRDVCLTMWKILHATPSGYHCGVADVSYQEITKFFGEIHIFLGEEIEAFYRFLTQGRRVLNVSLVHFEHRT